MTRREEEMTRLGLAGLIPFGVSAIALWASPWLVPQYIALDFHRFALIYGGIIVAYLAGGGAGAMLAPGSRGKHGFLTGQLITLAAFFAILPNGVFFLSIDAIWRHLTILILLIVLLRIDLDLVAAGRLPKWYGLLRMRLTLWAGFSIVLIMARLLLWGHY